jgi:hypothetical protein
VPQVTDRQWQALDLLAKLAEELCFAMSFAPGDIQLVNNHAIYTPPAPPSRTRLSAVAPRRQGIRRGDGPASDDTVETLWSVSIHTRAFS